MSVEVTGLQEVRDQLERIERRLRQPAELLDADAADLREVITAAFEAQATPSGLPWPPKRDGTRAGGSLQAATTVQRDGKTLHVHIAHPAATFQVFGTEHVPARNPLPVLAGGEPDGSGFWERLKRRARRAFSGERRIG